jgi:hypothetical protein
MARTIWLWFRKDAWRALWIALRRSPRDKKARFQLIRLALSLVLFGLWLTYYVFLFHGYSLNFGRTGDAVMAVLLIAIVTLITVPPICDRLEKRSKERASPSVSPELKKALFREACLLATLLQRLSSEKYLEKEIPPEVNIITRRVLLDRLSALGLREGLEPWLLDLLLAPDGHWTIEQKQRARYAWECLYVFRWALGMDQLPELTSVPKYKLADAQSLCEIKHPEKLCVLPSWDLRPARNVAGTFFHRCWAELLARRQVSTDDDGQMERALEFRAQIQEEGYTADYIVGGRTITELKTDFLFFIATRAYYRWQLLSLLVSVTAEELQSSALRGFLAHFFAKAEVEQALGSQETPGQFSQSCN